MSITTTPIFFLGKDRNSEAYYFYGAKDGIGRFLKFVKYPMWCGVEHIGNFIDIRCDLPEQIMAEILDFVNGRVRYEIEPKRRGRQEKVVKHVVEHFAQQCADIKSEQSTPTQARRPRGKSKKQELSPDETTETRLTRATDRRSVRSISGDTSAVGDKTSRRRLANEPMLLDRKGDRTRNRSASVIEPSVKPKPALLPEVAPKKRGRPRKQARAD